MYPDQPTTTTNQEQAMKTDNLTLWSRPSNYVGESWENYYVGPSQNRDSDALERSNFDSALAALGGESETVIVVREGHFLCGWVEWIAVYRFNNHQAVETLADIVERLEDYPVIDEDHLSEVEFEEASEVWQNCYNDAERLEYIRNHRSQFEFRDWGDVRQCVIGEYFGGYPSELIYR